MDPTSHVIPLCPGETPHRHLFTIDQRLPTTAQSDRRHRLRRAPRYQRRPRDRLYADSTALEDHSARRHPTSRTCTPDAITRSSTEPNYSTIDRQAAADLELRCFTPAQAADILGKGEWWVREAIRDGRIPHTSVGKSPRLTAAHIRWILANGERVPNQYAKAAR